MAPDMAHLTYSMPRPLTVALRPTFTTSPALTLTWTRAKTLRSAPPCQLCVDSLVPVLHTVACIPLEAPILESDVPSVMPDHFAPRCSSLRCIRPLLGLPLLGVRNATQTKPPTAPPPPVHSA